MKGLIKYFVVLTFTIALFAFQQKKTTIFMAGDSTMSIKDVKKRPETGWGMPFAKLFSDNVIVDNRAANGRSTKSFIEEGRWKGITDNLKEGDYVLIEFCHNDQPKEKKSHTTPEEFKHNLEIFVDDVKLKKGIPVLLTPIVRRKFDANGVFVDTHFEYPDLMRQVAKEKGVYLVDLYVKSKLLLEKLGKDGSIKLFNHLDSAQHINYPKGIKDDTHLSEYGAEMIANLAKEGMIELKIPISKEFLKN